MTVTGTLVQILPLESGVSRAGKEWRKQSIVIETQSQYPKKICVSIFGRTLDSMPQLVQGQSYDIDFDLSSRDYTNPTTGKVSWFTEVSAYRIALSANATTTQQVQQTYQQTQPPQYASPTPNLDSMGVQGYHAPQNNAPAPAADDLPF